MATPLSKLSITQRRRIVEQALVILEQLYVHLPLKEAMHAVRPVQRLRLLRDQNSRVPHRQAVAHEELIEIFRLVRDLHTELCCATAVAELS